MPKKTCFTKDQHIQHAEALGGARKAVFAAYADAIKTYPANSPVYQAICRAGLAMDALLVRLQDASQDEGHFTRYGDGSGCGWN